MKKVNIAVVGVGYLGRFHAQKYKAIENAQLVGVMDSSEERGRAVANELQVQYFKDLKELVGKVDAVAVAATTSAHFEICKFLLDNKIHVIVEKPITSTKDEGLELCKIAKANNLKLQVGHVERFNPALIAAHTKLKKPLFIECHRLAPFKPRGVDVNVVLDLMIHDLDMILHLVQSEPVRVDAVGTPVITKTFDIANARIEFANGAVANVTSSRVSLHAQRKFRVFQDSQYLSLDFGSGDVQLLSKTGEWVPDSLPPISQESWNLEKSDALLAESEAFVNSILNDTPCVVSGEDGVKALDLAERIIESIQSR